jgi:hypothetical protein
MLQATSSNRCVILSQELPLKQGGTSESGERPGVGGPD